MGGSAIGPKGKKGKKKKGKKKKSSKGVSEKTTPFNI